MPASLQSAVVMAGMTLASLPFMFRDRLARKASAAQWAAVGWLGVSDALNIVLFFAAYQRTKVAVAVLTHYLTPIFVALAAPIVLRERLRSSTFGAVLVSFLGLVLLLAPWRLGFGRNDVVGAAMGAGSAVFYTSNVLVNKRLVPVFSGSELMFFHGLVSTPLLFALVPSSDYALVAPAALAIVVLGALGPGTLGGLLFVWGLRRVPASHASVLTLLEPFVAVLLAAVVLGEELGLVPLCGGAMILASAVFVIAGLPEKSEAERPADGVQSPP